MLMNNLLMMFVENIFFVFYDDILMMLVDDVLMDFFNDGGVDVGSNISGKLVSLNGLAFVSLLVDCLFLMSNNDWLFVDLFDDNLSLNVGTSSNSDSTVRVGGGVGVDLLAGANEVLLASSDEGLGTSDNMSSTGVDVIMCMSVMGVLSMDVSFSVNVTCSVKVSAFGSVDVGSSTDVGVDIGISTSGDNILFVVNVL